jgi:sugar transferase EpsL
MDLFIGIPLCVLLSPLFILVAFVIMADSPGPVFFVQERRGLRFQHFRVFKFRSLRHNVPDPHEHYEMLQSDRRITRVGAFLRKTSLDELPQLFNVVLGSMSLVGPRPLVEWESQASLARHAERFCAKPGITGLSQLSGRNSLGFDARLDKDVEYVRRWSFFLDLQLILRTPLHVVRTRDVYPEAQQGATTSHE